MVLYRSAALRRHQYTRVTEWSGGLYISPGASPCFTIHSCYSTARPISSCHCLNSRKTIIHASLLLVVAGNLQPAIVRYIDSVARDELLFNDWSATGTACCLRAQPAECAWTWPGFAGSRSGALIATAWASMLHLGNEGFLRITAQIMQARSCLGTLASGESSFKVWRCPVVEFAACGTGACLRLAAAAARLRVPDCKAGRRVRAAHPQHESRLWTA